MTTTTEHRSGLVAIIGAPNVGKSTLLNRILGQKVAITSAKPQTTRHRILGVWTTPASQVIFFDTPGIHQSGNLLNKVLLRQALATLSDVDLILFMVETGQRREDHELVLKVLKDQNRPIILAINKIDMIKKDKLLPSMAAYSRALPLAAQVPISALTGEGVPDLLKEITEQLPEGPQYYPPDTVTDQPERLIAAEMIREQIFNMARQEIPYSTAVTVEEFNEDRDNLIRIKAVIHVERKSQKGIVIGKKGEMLKRIGTAARKDIERLTGTRIFLELFVRIEKNWSRDPLAMRRFGYE
ncbi:MAG: GTPase Era [Deltaproteobacteria bacterium]|nr:GTPase Era [Deltaproteobacteria bacterium]MBW2139974.1 GTPase Era [Deltaproteobacteria bacterium]MBW2322317.1 GTPase Era [Deltaproteobacteria bacterium]